VRVRRCPIRARQAYLEDADGRRGTPLNWVPLLSTSARCGLRCRVIRRIGEGVALLLLSPSAGSSEAMVRPLGHLAVVVIRICHESILTLTRTPPGSWHCSASGVGRRLALVVEGNQLLAQPQQACFVDGRGESSQALTDGRVTTKVATRVRLVIDGPVEDDR
jgi:hypothetical protein